MNVVRKVWITWERQRRSLVLSKEFNTAYYELLSGKKRLKRYVSLCQRTIQVLRKEKPEVLFVQNPSMVLALLACLFKIAFPRMVLIVDRHSNFFPLSNSECINVLHALLSNLTLRGADLTIVTNTYLKGVVEASGGRGVVLEDKIPEFSITGTVRLRGKANFLYVCSFDPDEPYAQVIDAARLIDGETCIYITGNYNKVRDKACLENLPANVVLLGFIPDEEYFDFMFHVDGIIVLTTWDHTLLCGAYEGVNAGRPLILSDKEDLIGYFRRGVVKTKNESRCIAQAIKEVLSNKGDLENEISVLRNELREEWRGKFEQVKKSIDKLICNGGDKGE